MSIMCGEINHTPRFFFFVIGKYSNPKLYWKQIINLYPKNRKSSSHACSEASLFLNANTLQFS